MQYEIKHRWTGAVLFTAALGAEYEAKSDGVTLGAAIKLAFRARADLTGANLAGADLAGAYLAGAFLAGADAVIDAGTPNSWRAVGWRRDGTLRVRVGCRDFTVAEGREYWRGKSERREVMAALDYIEAVARLRGWPEAGETKQAA